MNETRDVLVVGSGFGGLSAAALAAASGLNTLLVERHTRPGGCAGDFALEGFTFPAGATVVTGLEEGGILRQLFDAVGIPVEAAPLDPSIVFHVGAHSLAYSEDVRAWTESLRVFPESRAYDRFWRWTHEIGGAIHEIGSALPSLPLQKWADVRRTWPAASPAAARLLPLTFQTIARVKRRLGAVGSAEIDALVDSLLMDSTGAAAGECSAIQGAVALDLYRRGCQWVDGGTGKLAMDLVRVARGHGADVKFAAEVVSLVPGSTGWEARFASGETVHARRVIANVPPGALARLRGARAKAPKERDAWGAFVLHLGIDAGGLAPIHPYHQMVNPAAPEAGSLVSILPMRKAAPRWAISVSSHVRPSEWRPGCGSDLQRRRAEEALIDGVATVIPDLRDRVMVQRSATPATFERYTARPRGFVGGLVQRPGRVALRAPGHRPERGLFLAGDHVFPGQGTVGTALSGINAYRDAAESLGVRPLL